MNYLVLCKGMNVEYEHPFRELKCLLKFNFQGLKCLFNLCRVCCRDRKTTAFTQHCPGNIIIIIIIIIITATTTTTTTIIIIVMIINIIIIIIIISGYGHRIQSKTQI